MMWALFSIVPGPQVGCLWLDSAIVDAEEETLGNSTDKVWVEVKQRSVAAALLCREESTKPWTQPEYVNETAGLVIVHIGSVQTPFNKTNH